MDVKILENLIVKGMITDKSYLAIISSVFDSNYFESDTIGKIFLCLKEHLEKFNSIAPRDIIIGKVGQEAKDILDEVDVLEFDVAKDYDCLFEETNTYLKDKAIKNAILLSVDKINSGPDHIKDIYQIIEGALIKDLKIDLGENYFQDFKKRLASILTHSTKRIPTYFPLFDEYISGGFPPYTLSVIVSKIHGWKCLSGNTKIIIRDRKTRKITNASIGLLYNCFSSTDSYKYNRNHESLQGVSDMKRLEMLQKKYGKEEGERRYYLWRERASASHKGKIGQLTYEWYVEKYGPYDGWYRYANKVRNQTASLKGVNSLDFCIKKYGEVEGKKFYEEKNKKISDPGRGTMDYFIRKYGDEEGNKRYNLYIKRMKFSLSLEGYVEKYGADIGTKKWNEFCDNKSKVQTLDGFKKKYGKGEGERRWCDKREKWTNTMNNKSDEEKEIILSKKTNIGISKISKEIAKTLEKEYNVSIGKEEIILPYIVDMLYKNNVIEVYGDYWHCNPLMYEASFYNKSKSMLASDIWKYDSKRVNELRSMGYNVIIIWERDWKKDKETVLKGVEHVFR